MGCEFIEDMAEFVGIETPRCKTAKNLVTEINLMANSSEGKVRYNGRILMSFFRSWSAHKDDMSKIAPQFRTSEEVNQFIKDYGTTMFNQNSKRSLEQELSDSEIEGIRRTMIDTGNYPMLE